MCTMTIVYHVAIEDDWESGLNLGSYEAASRGVPFGPGEPIRAVRADLAQHVLDDRYADFPLQLYLIAIDLDALIAQGTEVEWAANGKSARILAPLPAGDGAIIVGVIGLELVAGRWIAPNLDTQSGEEAPSSR